MLKNNKKTAIIVKKSQTQPQKHLTLLKSEAGANSGVFLMPDHRLKAMFYFA